MRHNLDIKPVPEDVLYINELDFLRPEAYANAKVLAKTATGLTVNKGGILPEDNVRIYLPLDINADSIFSQLEQLYAEFGCPTEENESLYSLEVEKLISQLEVYDQVMVARDLKDAVQMNDGGAYHSKKCIALVKRIVEFMDENEGSAEC